MSIIDVWVIYDHPKDFPNEFVARKYDLDLPTDTLIQAPTLSHLQETFIKMGLTKIPRHPNDDPCITESWI